MVLTLNAWSNLRRVAIDKLGTMGSWEDDLGLPLSDDTQNNLVNSSSIPNYLANIMSLIPTATNAKLPKPLLTIFAGHA